MAEFRVLTLQKKLHRLCSNLDRVVISTALFSNEIIDDKAWEKARIGPNYDNCLQLLETLIGKIKTRPSIFEEFCKILEEDAATKDLASELIEELKVLESNSKKPENDHKEAGVKRKMSELPPAAKRKLVIKAGPIEEDKVLLDIAWEVGDKWEEVGVALGLDYMVLKNVISSEPERPDMKAFHMLHEWKRRIPEQTYGMLASALEGTGLNTCAKKYCYSQTSENER